MKIAHDEGTETSMNAGHREVALGKVIRRARARAGINQTTLGQQIGITFQQVQKYEKGTNRVHFTRLLDICEALDTTPEELLREYRDLVEMAQSEGSDPGPEDRTYIRLLGLAHQVDEGTLSAVTNLLAARVRSDKGNA